VDVIIHPLLNVVDDRLGGRAERGGGRDDDDDERSGRKYSWQDVEASTPVPMSLSPRNWLHVQMCTELLPYKTLPSRQSGFHQLPRR
jgi:hypothetical protein